MSEVFRELVDHCQDRYKRLRQLTQFYHRFAGQVIRIQQDRDCILTHMGSSGGTVQLQFEERDEDGFGVKIVPFRNDLVFVQKVGFWAELHFELFRFCLDSMAIQRVNQMSFQSRTAAAYSGVGNRQARIRGRASQALHQPGVMKFRSNGSRVYVSTMLIWDLSAFEVSPGVFHREALTRDLDAVSHGLEKCLDGVLGKAA